MNLPRPSHLIVVTLSSSKPLFFNGLKPTVSLGVPYEAACLGGGRELPLFLGPLRLLLFFRRHGWFLFIFPLIFDLFRHGMCSQDLRGVLWMQATLAPTRRGRQSAAVT